MRKIGDFKSNTLKVERVPKIFENEQYQRRPNEENQ